MFDSKKRLPFYLPKNRRFKQKLHLAIWNCGTYPQTLFQKICNLRITIRRNHVPLFVLKKGSI